MAKAKVININAISKDVSSLKTEVEAIKKDKITLTDTVSSDNTTEAVTGKAVADYVALNAPEEITIDQQVTATSQNVVTSKAIHEFVTEKVGEVDTKLESKSAILNTAERFFNTDVTDGNTLTKVIEGIQDKVSIDTFGRTISGLRGEFEEELVKKIEFGGQISTATTEEATEKGTFRAIILSARHIPDGKVTSISYFSPNGTNVDSTFYLAICKVNDPSADTIFITDVVAYSKEAKKQIIDGVNTFEFDDVDVSDLEYLCLVPYLSNTNSSTLLSAPSSMGRIRTATVAEETDNGDNIFDSNLTRFGGDTHYRAAVTISYVSHTVATKVTDDPNTIPTTKAVNDRVKEIIAEVEGGIVVDKKYDANSDNAQSGKAVAEAISTKADSSSLQNYATKNDLNGVSEAVSNLKGTVASKVDQSSLNGILEPYAKTETIEKTYATKESLNDYVTNTTFESSLGEKADASELSSHTSDSTIHFDEGQKLAYEEFFGEDFESTTLKSIVDRIGNLEAGGNKEITIDQDWDYETSQYSENAQSGKAVAKAVMEVLEEVVTDDDFAQWVGDHESEFNDLQSDVTDLGLEVEGIKKDYATNESLNSLDKRVEAIEDDYVTSESLSASLSEYATESYVDEAISNIEIPSVATELIVDDTTDAVSGKAVADYVDGKGYVEGTDFQDFKNEVESTYATNNDLSSYVDNAIGELDIPSVTDTLFSNDTVDAVSGKAVADYIAGKNYADDSDLQQFKSEVQSTYATNDELNSLQSSVDEKASLEDIEGFVTQSDIDESIEQFKSVEGISELKDKVDELDGVTDEITEIKTNISEIESSLNDKLESSDLEDYATKSEVEQTYTTKTEFNNHIGDYDTHFSNGEKSELYDDIESKADKSELTTHTSNNSIHLSSAERTKFNTIIKDYDDTTSIKSLLDTINSLSTQLTELRSYVDDNFIKGIVVNEDNLPPESDRKDGYNYFVIPTPPPMMELNIISPSDGFVDFSYILGNDENLEYTEDASIDWGDGSEIVEIVGNEYENNPSKLQHTYAENNKEYKITIKGKIKWSGKTSSANISNGMRKTITSIELPTNNSPIQFITAYGFYRFLNLQSIPEGLFDNCTKVTDFNSCFYSCSSLQSIPKGLFDKCTEVTIFNRCFYGCSSLQSIPKGLFDNCAKVTNFDYCFEGCSSVTSNLPTLWISHPNASHNWCFNECNNAPNYADAYNAGWASSPRPTISLSLNTLNDNSIVDLSSHITPTSDNQEVTVNWGDGSEIETLQIDSIQHTYATKGEYIVEIDGDIEYNEPKTRAIVPFTISNVRKNDK